MDRITEWNREHTHGSLVTGDGYTRLAEYEDANLTPEEVIQLREQLDLARADIQKLSNQVHILNTKCDYWERESKKWCDQSFEYRLQL